MQHRFPLYHTALRSSLENRLTKFLDRAIIVAQRQDIFYSLGMATLIGSLPEDSSFAEAQKQLVFGSFLSEENGSKSRRSERKMIVDKFAAGIANVLQAQIEPSPSIDIDQKVIHSNDPNRPFHTVSCVSSSSSMTSYQSNDYSDYSLSVNSVKRSAAASVTGAPETLIRSLIENKGDHYDSTPISYKCKFEGYLSRDPIRSNLLQQSSTGRYGDLMVSGGHESHSSFESSLEGSFGFLPFDLEDDIEEATAVSSYSEAEVDRAQAILGLGEENSISSNIVTPACDSVCTCNLVLAKSDFISSHSSVVSALSTGTNDTNDTNKTTGTNRTNGTCTSTRTLGSTGDYSLEVCSQKHSAISSITGIYGKPLWEASFDEGVFSFLRKISREESLDLKGDLEESFISLGDMEDDIDRIHALLEARPT